MAILLIVWSTFSFDDYFHILYAILSIHISDCSMESEMLLYDFCLSLLNHFFTFQNVYLHYLQKKFFTVSQLYDVGGSIYIYIWGISHVEAQRGKRHRRNRTWQLKCAMLHWWVNTDIRRRSKEMKNSWANGNRKQVNMGETERRKYQKHNVQIGKK